MGFDRPRMGGSGCDSSAPCSSSSRCSPRSSAGAGAAGADAGRHRGRGHRPHRRARRAAPRRHVGRGPARRAAAPPPPGAGAAGCSRPARSRCASTPSGDYRQVPMDPAPGSRVPHVPRVVRRPVRRQRLAATRSSSASTRASIAEQLVRDLPYPAATVGANPAGRGLTGLASWFWVDGYSGAPIVDTVDAVRHDRDRRGDARPRPTGTSATAPTGNGLGLGTAPPAPVDGRPTSSRCGPGRRYRVRALIRLAVRWRLGAGPWQTLAPVLRTAVLDYPVVVVPRRARPRPLTGRAAATSRDRKRRVTHG